MRIKWVNKYKHLLSAGHRVVFVWLYLLISVYLFSSSRFVGLPWWLRWWRICLQWRRPGFDSWVGKTPWRREWQPTPVFFPGKSHGQRSLEGYSPWGHRVGHDWAHRCTHIGSSSANEGIELSKPRSFLLENSCRKAGPEQSVAENDPLAILCLGWGTQGCRFAPCRTGGGG